MAAFEPYDFLTAANGYTDPGVPDYDYTLTIKAQGQVIEEGYKNQVIHLADDNSEERITLSTGSMFWFFYDWKILTEANSGLIFDLYHDSAKANGMGNSFKLTAHDSHTYVVRFDCKLQRAGQAVSRWAIPGVKFRILGRIADA